MAYDARHKQICAYAVALCGGNVASAARHLKETSVECPDISERTLRRYMSDAEFLTLVEQQSKIILSERDEATRNAERARLKREMEGSFGARLASLERTAWDLFERIAAEVEKPETDKKEILAFWQKAMEFVTKLKAQKTPAIAETWQAEALIRAYNAALSAKLGPALTEEIQKETAKRYREIIAAEQEARANAESPAPSE